MRLDAQVVNLSQFRRQTLHGAVVNKLESKPATQFACSTGVQYRSRINNVTVSSEGESRPSSKIPHAADVALAPASIHPPVQRPFGRVDRQAIRVGSLVPDSVVRQLLGKGGGGIRECDWVPRRLQKCQRATRG